MQAVSTTALPLAVDIGPLRQVLVQQELCYGDISIGNFLTSNGFFAGPIEAIGSAEQRKRWLGLLCSDVPPALSFADVRVMTSLKEVIYGFNGVDISSRSSAHTSEISRSRSDLENSSMRMRSSANSFSARG